MNLEFVVNKDTCFYYWLQAVSGWDENSPEPDVYLYYQNDLAKRGVTKIQKDALQNVKTILKKSSDPRRILAKLYEYDPDFTEARDIANTSSPLRSAFEDVWVNEYPFYKKSKEYLSQMNLDSFVPFLKKVIHFFNSPLAIDERLVVYLILNPGGYGSGGHVLRETSFILLHPSRLDNKPNDILTRGVLIHEYIHHIENRSSNSRTFYKKAFEKHIQPNKLIAPNYAWKMVFVETMVYCFANGITGGYLRPELYDKPMPTVAEMEDDFKKLVKSKKYNTNHVISWVALQILPEVKRYIDTNKPIDQQLVDQVAKYYKSFYSTKS